jgi:hypothetical protein
LTEYQAAVCEALAMKAFLPKVASLINHTCSFKNIDFRSFGPKIKASPHKMNVCFNDLSAFQFKPFCMMGLTGPASL